MEELSHQLAIISCKVIRERRLELQLSQDVIAARTGLARSYLSDVERGCRHPTLHNLTLLAHALDWSASELIIEIEQEAISLLDPERLRLSQQGKAMLSQLEQEIIHYVNNRMKDGVLIANAAAKLVLFNKQSEQSIYGRSAISEMLPASWSSEYGLFRPDRHTLMPLQELTIPQVLYSGRQVRVPMFIRNHQTGEGAHFDVIGRPVRDRETGTIKGAYAILTRLR